MKMQKKPVKVTYTVEAAQEIADAIEVATGGRFRAPYISRPGDRVNIVDSNRMVSWNGPRAAMAYYIAILNAVAPEVCGEGWFRSCLDAVDAKADKEPYERGVEDAMYYR